MATKTHTPKEDVVVLEAEKAEVQPELKAVEQFVEHERKALTEAGKALISLVPEPVQTHGEAAIKEAVVGYRDLVNTTLDGIIEFVQKAKLESSDKEEKI